ncbi:MAG: hypothetical protein RL196_425 [Actinomycetota bacterium]
MSLETLQSTVDSVIDEVIERQLAAGEGKLFANGDTFHQDFETNLRQAAQSRLDGFGVLQAFIDDPAIEEVWVNHPNEVFVASAAGHQRMELDLSADALSAIVEKMLRSCGRRLDRSTPFVDASLPDGSRLHVIIPSLTKAHWSVNIRKFSRQVLSLDHLLANQSVTETQKQVLHDAIVSGKNILVSGATQAGKTTLLCALLNELAQPRFAGQERLVSVEETFEIRTNLPDWVALQARQANLEGIGEVSLRRLIVEALRMRPTRLVVGEVRQAEALDLLIALNSGLPGLCTIHANSADDAVLKLATLPLLAGGNITRDFVVPTVASCIDLVVHCAQVAPGVRKVIEVRSVELSESRKELVTSHVC